MEITQPGGGVSGGGTVTSVSIVSANGFAGTVATPTTTPAITLSTTITGLLKGDGTSISAAVLGTDYGNVVGPASSNDTAIARYSGTTGKIIQDYASNPPLITSAGQVFFGPSGIPAVGTSFNVNTTDLNTNVIFNSFQATGSINAAGSAQSLNFNVTDTGTNSVTSIAGVNGNVSKSGSGTITSIIGIAGSCRLQGTAVATLMSAFSGQNRAQNGTSAVAMVTYNALANTIGATGAVTAAYAFKAAAMKVTNVTTGYGFASDGTTDINYMLGTLGVGNSAPTVRLHVSGDIRTQAVTVATLASAATAGIGSRSFVTDALAPSFGVAATGGGTVSVPVYSDGATWLVG